MHYLWPILESRDHHKYTFILRLFLPKMWEGGGGGRRAAPPGPSPRSVTVYTPRREDRRVFPSFSHRSPPPWLETKKVTIQGIASNSITLSQVNALSVAHLSWDKIKILDRLRKSYSPKQLCNMLEKHLHEGLNFLTF